MIADLTEMFLTLLEQFSSGILSAVAAIIVVNVLNKKKSKLRAISDVVTRFVR